MKRGHSHQPLLAEEETKRRRRGDLPKVARSWDLVPGSLDPHLARLWENAWGKPGVSFSR